MPYEGDLHGLLGEALYNKIESRIDVRNTSGKVYHGINLSNIFII